jgi:plasmid replication initiation protein
MSNRQIVKQDYKLVNARYDLNLNEIKIILNAISEINIDDKDFQVYKIKLRNISQELENQSLARSYTRIKKFCEDLLKKPLYIPRDHGGFLVVNWFASLEYISGSAEIEYEISPKLKPYLLELKERFVQYSLKYILPLKSTYSIKIYQLLKEYEKLKERTFELEELQMLLQVPESYKIKYNDFKKKVLQIAERELKEHCDIYFEFEEIKKGRKVSEILFKIKKNEKFNITIKSDEVITIEPKKSKISTTFNEFKANLIKKYNNKGAFINNVTELKYFKEVSFSIKNSLLLNCYSLNFLDKDNAFELYQYMFANQDKIKMFEINEIDELRSKYKNTAFNMTVKNVLGTFNKLKVIIQDIEKQNDKYKIIIADFETGNNFTNFELLLTKSEIENLAYTN